MSASGVWERTELPAAEGMWAVGARLGRVIDGQLHAAEVVAVDPGGLLVSLRYDDGCFESGVALDEVEVLPQAPAPAPAPAAQDRELLAAMSSLPSQVRISSCDLAVTKQRRLESVARRRRRSKSFVVASQADWSGSEARPELDLLPLAARCLTCSKHCIWRCRKCGVAFYCSKSCQLAGLAAHMPQCIARPFKPLFVAADTLASSASASSSLRGAALAASHADASCSSSSSSAWPRLAPVNSSGGGGGGLAARPSSPAETEFVPVGSGFISLFDNDDDDDMPQLEGAGAGDFAVQNSAGMYSHTQTMHQGLGLGLGGGRHSDDVWEDELYGFEADRPPTGLDVYAQPCGSGVSEGVSRSMTVPLRTINSNTAAAETQSLSDRFSLRAQAAQTAPASQSRGYGLYTGPEVDEAAAADDDDDDSRAVCGSPSSSLGALDGMEQWDWD